MGPVPAMDEFNADDVKQLVEYERGRRIRPVLEAAAELHALDNIDGYASFPYRDI